MRTQTFRGALWEGTWGWGRVHLCRRGIARTHGRLRHAFVMTDMCMYVVCTVPVTFAECVTWLAGDVGDFGHDPARVPSHRLSECEHRLFVSASGLRKSVLPPLTFRVDGTRQPGVEPNEQCVLDSLSLVGRPWAPLSLTHKSHAQRGYLSS